MGYDIAIRRDTIRYGNTIWRDTVRCETIQFDTIFPFGAILSYTIVIFGAILCDTIRKELIRYDTIMCQTLR